MTRRTPYTDKGIRRIKCWRADCNNRAAFQWQACADGRAFRPVCAECDVAINAMVLDFMGDPDREAKMAAYRQRVGLN